jgi:glycosyltransferase involved in cell wall biosynthesis
VGAQVVHAWGVQAARSARENLRDLPLVLTLLDPAATRDAARWVRAMPVGTTVAAGSQIIRTRLIRSGISLDRVVVIRGGVDFGAINTARESDHRERLVGDGGPVILMLGPASRGGGQYYGLWAAAIVAQIHRKLRIILPYGGSEAERLNRFVRQIKMPELMVTDATRTWPELLAAADVLLCPAIDEVCTEPIAWAMASGVAVVGCAVRSVCEMIADKHNGLLCKPKAPRSLAGRILTALEDGELRRRITEAARGQAYEVFSVRAMADNYLRLYENVLAGRPAAEGISDTAMVA